MGADFDGCQSPSKTDDQRLLSIEDEDANHAVSISKESYIQILDAVHSSIPDRRLKNVKNVANSIFENLETELSPVVPWQDLAWIVKSDVPRILKNLRAKDALYFAKLALERGAVDFEASTAHRWNVARRNFEEKLSEKEKSKNADLEVENSQNSHVESSDFSERCDRKWNNMPVEKREKLVQGIPEKLDDKAVLSGYNIFYREHIKKPSGTAKDVASSWHMLEPDDRLRYDNVALATLYDRYQMVQKTKNVKHLTFLVQKIRDAPFFAYFCENYDKLKTKHPDLDIVGLAKKGYKRFRKLDAERLAEFQRKVGQLAKNLQSLISKAKRESPPSPKKNIAKKLARFHQTRTQKVSRPRDSLDARGKKLHLPPALASLCPQSYLPHFYAFERKRLGSLSETAKLRSEYSELPEVEKSKYRELWNLRRDEFTEKCDEYLASLPTESVEKTALQERLNGMRQYLAKNSNSQSKVKECADFSPCRSETRLLEDEEVSSDSTLKSPTKKRKRSIKSPIENQCAEEELDLGGTVKMSRPANP